eukprot:m.334255 g.334255  ORF g.334255 m.334255 type:complete len:137 (-) comp16526_c0_seq3:96-506(-)
MRAACNKQSVTVAGQAPSVEQIPAPPPTFRSADAAAAIHRNQAGTLSEAPPQPTPAAVPSTACALKHSSIATATPQVDSSQCLFPAASASGSLESSFHSPRASVVGQPQTRGCGNHGRLRDCVAMDSMTYHPCQFR